MTLKDLQEILGLDTFLFIDNGEDSIEVGADSPFIPLFSELRVIQIYAENLHIKVAYDGDSEK